MGIITNHLGSILFISWRLHLHEHVLNAVNIRAVLPAPPSGPGQRGGLRGGVGASVGGIVEVVGGLFESCQSRLVRVAVGRGTPQVGAAASSAVAAGSPVAPRGRRGLRLHHVWGIRCRRRVNGRSAGTRTAASWSCAKVHLLGGHTERTRTRQSFVIVTFWHICNENWHTMLCLMCSYKTQSFSFMT